MGKSHKGRVVLYQPHLVPPDEWSADYLAIPPLSLLALGGPLHEAGYAVRLIDAKWERGSRGEVAQAVGDAVALGVSCLTGYSVRDGLDALRRLRGRLRGGVPAGPGVPRAAGGLPRAAA